MCYFIVVGIPKKASKGWDNTLPSNATMWPSHYQSLINAFPEFTLFNVGVGGCSCDFYRQDDNIDEAALERKYKKMGWSTNKVRRAILDKMQNRQEHGIDRAIRDWVASIADRDGNALVMVHWDSDELPELSSRYEIATSQLRMDSDSVPIDKLTIISGAANPTIRTSSSS